MEVKGYLWPVGFGFLGVDYLSKHFFLLNDEKTRIFVSFLCFSAVLLFFALSLSYDWATGSGSILLGNHQHCCKNNFKPPSLKFQNTYFVKNGDSCNALFYLFSELNVAQTSMYSEVYCILDKIWEIISSN